MFIIEPREVNDIWSCSAIFFEHVSLSCFLFDPHQTTYQNAYKGLIKETNHLRPIYLIHLYFHL